MEAWAIADTDSDTDADCWTEVCDFIFPCEFATEIFTSIEDCYAEEWSDCSDPDDVKSCMCDCLDTSTDCETAQICGSACLDEFCP